jgi:hypothetical protein
MMRRPSHPGDATMDIIELIVAWAIVAVAAGIAAFVLAGVKNRDASAWAAWCFLVPPLVIALALAPKNPGPKPRRAKLDELDREVF